MRTSPRTALRDGGTIRILAAIAILVVRPIPAPAQSEELALTPFQTARTERLLESRVACRGCHQIAGRGGRIGPSLDGIGTRADAAYVLEMIRDPASTVPGTIMPRQRMREREARRLAQYLIALPPVSSTAAEPPQAPPALPAGAEVDGSALYARHCAACHGETGRSDGWNVTHLGVIPSVHADATAMSQRPDDTLYDGIAAGGFVLDKSPLMPAFGELLSAEQIQALVSHIRSICSCSQPAWAEPGR